MRAILGPPFCARGGYGSATPFRSWKIGLANADVEALERGCDASADNAPRMMPLDMFVVSAAMKPAPTLPQSAAHGVAVASRDTSAFNAAGLTIIDPWTVTN